MTTTSTKMAPTQSAKHIVPRTAFSVDPFHSMDRRIGHALNRFLRDRVVWGDYEEDFSLSTWTPACDIFETNDEFLVKAELPEVKKQDVSITFGNNVLTLRGEREFETGETGENIHRLESHYGEFQRSFTLPSAVDADKISAEFKDGVLRLRLPKRPESKSKHIDIRLR